MFHKCSTEGKIVKNPLQKRDINLDEVAKKWSSRMDEVAKKKLRLFAI